MRAFVLRILCIALVPLCASGHTIKLALNWKPEPQFGGFYAAQFIGAFKKNGIDVVILPGGAGTPVVQMVAAGQADFGIASADEVVLMRSRGGDAVALFAAYQTNPQGIMTHSERGFKTLADVFSHTGILAMQKGLPYSLYLDSKFPSANSKVKAVPYLGGVQNFLADPNYSQQCFVTSEPLAAEKMKAKVTTFLIADAGYNPYTTVLIARETLIKSKPELVKKMVAAVRAGWRQYLDHPEIANAEMHKLNPSMDEETFALSAKAQQPLIETTETRKSGLGTMTAERWSQLTEQLYALKLIKAKPEIKTLFLNP